MMSREADLDVAADITGEAWNCALSFTVWTIAMACVSGCLVCSTRLSLVINISIGQCVGFSKAAEKPIHAAACLAN
jgi:hypothetical protein